MAASTRAEREPDPMMAFRRTLVALALAQIAGLGPVLGQDTASVRLASDSVQIRFVESDLGAVIRALSGYLAKPLLVSDIAARKVSFETPMPVPRAYVLGLLKGLVEGYGLTWLEDSLFFRVGPKAAEVAPAVLIGGAGQGAPELRVLRLKHARAADVAATVNLLFGGGSEFSGRPGLSQGTLSDQLRRSSEPSPAAPPARLPATLSGPVTMVPDELTNSLLIRSSPVDYELLRQAIAELDVRPLQVLIEVLIVETRKDRSLTVGFAADFSKKDGDSKVDGGFGVAGTGDVVLRFMRLARTEVSALLTAAQAKGDVEIISRPVLLASNNTEARFLVGSQRPFIQVSRSLPTDVPSRDQVVQYRDVGTKLTVRPTINQDGYVSLVIQQEISGATDESQFGAPIISTREAKTQVLVKDGQTIVLGGLRDQQRDRSRSGIPLLSSIPGIGGLFGSTRRRSSSTELYLFLTPRIIRTDGDVDSVTAPRLPPTKPQPNR